MRIFLASLLILASSVDVAAQGRGAPALEVPAVNLRFRPPRVQPADSDQMTAVRQSVARLRGNARRCVEGYSGERTGDVVLLVQLEFTPEGQLASQSMRERGTDSIDDPLTGCLLRTITHAFRARPFPGLVSATIPLVIRLPPTPQPSRADPGPNHADLARAAIEEANNARAFGRCYLDAGNQLRAAGRSLRRAGNEAERARALARVERARQAIGRCTLMGTLGSGINAQPAYVPSCPHCLNMGQSERGLSTVED